MSNCNKCKGRLWVQGLTYYRELGLVREDEPCECTKGIAEETDA